MEITLRYQALKLDQPKYFTGKQCKYGHISLRETKSGQCVECSIIRGRKSYENNKEKHLARTHKWQLANYERVLSSNKRYQATHKEEVAAYNRERYINQKDIILARGNKWKKDNPHQIVKHNRLRQTKIQRAIPPWFEADLVKQLYLKRDELNKKLGLKLVVDHVIPLNPKDKSVCGLHCWANLQLLDKSSNAIKHDTYETNW